MTRRLPNDICRCANDDCPLRTNCARWLNWLEGIGDRVVVALLQPEPGGKRCEHLIVDDEKK